MNQPPMDANLALRRNHWFPRDDGNLVLTPEDGSPFDSSACMNPCVVVRGREYWMYYAGGDHVGRKRICLATARIRKPNRWTRKGVVLDLGEDGAYDGHWLVMPSVVQLGDKWHLYYATHCGQGEGLSAFKGLGLAISEDGEQFTKREDINPILAPTGNDGDEDAVGIGGGSVLQVHLPDGSIEWRYYYTAAPTLGESLHDNQQKSICYATSADGIEWEKRGPVMKRRDDIDYEDVAVAAPQVRQEADGSFRMWYSAIGTRFGAYSICYAESDDGVTWRRGYDWGENLVLAPTGLEGDWESQMVEYPFTIAEGPHQRLFYCGNGYGKTGIGTALSSTLRATGLPESPCGVDLVSEPANARWILHIPETFACDEGAFKTEHYPHLDWNGPEADGSIWLQWEAGPEDLEEMSVDLNPLEKPEVELIDGMAFSVRLTPNANGIEIDFEATNTSDRTFHNVVVDPSLGHPTDGFDDPELAMSYIRTNAGVKAIRELDQGDEDNPNAHFIVNGGKATRLAPAFWGRPSRTIATGNAILRTRSDGAYTIGIAWERVAELVLSNDQNQTIHSVGSLGDIKPGETRMIKGRIVLVTGGIEPALDQLESLSRPPDLGLPEDLF